MTEADAIPLPETPDQRTNGQSIAEEELDEDNVTETHRQQADRAVAKLNKPGVDIREKHDNLGSAMKEYRAKNIQAVEKRLPELIAAGTDIIKTEGARQLRAEYEATRLPLLQKVDRLLVKAGVRHEVDYRSLVEVTKEQAVTRAVRHRQSVRTSMIGELSDKIDEFRKEQSSYRSKIEEHQQEAISIKDELSTAQNEKQSLGYMLDQVKNELKGLDQQMGTSAYKSDPQFQAKIDAERAEGISKSKEYAQALSKVTTQVEESVAAARHLKAQIQSVQRREKNVKGRLEKARSYLSSRLEVHAVYNDLDEQLIGHFSDEGTDLFSIVERLEGTFGEDFYEVLLENNIGAFELMGDEAYLNPPQIGRLNKMMDDAYTESKKDEVGGAIATLDSMIYG